MVVHKLCIFNQCWGFFQTFVKSHTIVCTEKKSVLNKNSSEKKRTVIWDLISFSNCDQKLFRFQKIFLLSYSQFKKNLIYVDLKGLSEASLSSLPLFHGIRSNPASSAPSPTPYLLARILEGSGTTAVLVGYATCSQMIKPLQNEMILQ